MVLVGCKGSMTLRGMAHSSLQALSLVTEHGLCGKEKYKIIRKASVVFIVLVGCKGSMTP